MNKRAIKGWRFNSANNKYDYSVYNSAGAIKPVFDEDGTIYQAGIAITSTAAELNELDISVKGAVRKIKILPVSVAGAGTEKDSGWSLPANAIVVDVFVNVKTAATAGTKTIDVGTLSSASGDADGYLDGVSVGTAGIVKGSLASATKGVLLKEVQTIESNSFYAPVPDTGSGGKKISYTLGDSVAGLVADIIIDYIEIA